MRLLASNKHLPGFTDERVEPHDGEWARVAVYDPTGAPFGTVVYVRVGNDYGWRPVDQPDAPLTTKIDAILAIARNKADDR